jgi:hypothetical protein
MLKTEGEIMTLPINKKSEKYSELPMKIRILVFFLVILLNKLNDYLEPYNMAPYFCINSYEEEYEFEVEEDEDEEIIKH